MTQSETSDNRNCRIWNPRQKIKIREVLEQHSPSRFDYEYPRA